MLPAILKHTALARTEAHHLFCFSLCMLNYSFVCGANYNPSNMANWRVRDAVAEDVPDILRMIKDLAVYEKEHESRVKLTEEEMLRDGFGDRPWFECLIAEEINLSEANTCLPKKKPVGYALFYYVYSTWEGRSLFLEDIYVNPTFRGKGIGTDMLKRVSAIALEKGCERVDWNCLNWNETAKDFYNKLGAIHLDEWQLYRLTGERLLEFVGKENK